MKKINLAVLLLVLAMIFTSCGLFDLTLGTTNPSEVTEVITGEELLKVSFIDVGQGDSAFIEFPNGKCMLIDAAEKEESGKVINYLKHRGCKKIDYFIVTHPHSDHMGGAVDVMESFVIGVLYMTNAVNNTSSFEELLDTVERKGITLKRSMRGVEILKDENVKAEFLSPVSEEYEELNDYSSVVKISAGKLSFLFMGDAEKLVEDELGTDVKANVVKIGHHGSKTSSSAKFVKSTGADFAVISVGEANKYGHPNSEIVSRWESIGAKILRTDVDGNIVFTTDGEKLSIKCEKTDGVSGEVTLSPDVTATVTEQNRWVLNTSSKKIHKPDCSGAEKIGEENKEISDKSIEELLAQGYTACGICKPTDDGVIPEPDNTPNNTPDITHDATPDITPDTTPAETEDSAEYKWVLNTSTKKIHYHDCSSAKKIADKNRAESSQSIAELCQNGYTTCGICKPKE